MVQVTRTLAAEKIPDWNSLLSRQFTTLHDSFAQKFARAARNHASKTRAGHIRSAKYGLKEPDDWRDDKVEAYSFEGGDEIVDSWSSSNLFGTINLAYSHHLPLKLSPDDLWITITSGVARHINYGVNGEEYRKKFVAHKGREDISVQVDRHRSSESFLEENCIKALGWKLNWPACVDDIVAQVQKRTLPSTTEKLVADFSTTTPAAHTASQIVIMESMKKYFSYKMVLACGIPEITLVGTENDWTKLVEKTKGLKMLHIDLDNWLDGVVSVLDKFLETYKGEVDEDFWSKIMTSERYGSGGQRKYSGWILKLFPYDCQGDLMKSSMASGDEPVSFVKCPFVMDDNGTEWDMHLYAGHLGTRVNKGQNGTAESVSPHLGWMVVRRGPKA